jgi:HAE1 family hydrophobic/amphiphilic exporter-1
MTYALMASLIVALTLVPAMASGMLKKDKEIKTPLMDKFLGGYEKCAAWALKHKAIVLIVATVLLVGSSVWALLRGYIFMPQMDMPSLTVTITMPEDATPVKAAELADEVLARIETVEGIESVGAMQASAMNLTGGLDQGGDSLGNITVYVNFEGAKEDGFAHRVDMAMDKAFPKKKISIIDIKTLQPAIMEFVFKDVEKIL